MASEAYRIPFAPLDFSGIADAIRGGREHRRSMEYLAMERQAVKDRAERESKALARQEANDKYNREVAAFNARPAIERAAMRSFRATGTPGSANMNPYGITFDVQQDAPPSIKDVDIMGAKGGQYGEHARAILGMRSDRPIGATGEPSQATTDLISPTEDLSVPIEGPQQAVDSPEGRVLIGTGLQLTPELRRSIGEGRVPLGTARDVDITSEASRFENSLSPGEDNARAVGEAMVSGRVADDSPSPGITAAQAIMGSPRKSKLYGMVNGQRYEVPEMNDSTGLGQEYDAMFNRFREMPGVSDKDAIRLVAAQYKADRAEGGRNTRASNQIDFRNQNREDTQAFQQGENEKYKETHQGRIELIDRAGRYKVQAAGPQFKQEGVNDRLYGLLDRRIKQVKDTAQYGKLAAENKTVRSIMANIANGSVPLQHADAQISLARFFRQAQPTEGEMHMLYSNLGGTMDKWNQFVARISRGDLSAEQMRQLKAAAKSVQREHEENLHRFKQVAQKGLGPGNGLDLIPDQAQHAFEMLGAELGMDDLGHLYDTEGGITLGSGQAPKVQPRGAKKTALDQLEEELDAMGRRGGR